MDSNDNRAIAEFLAVTLCRIDYLKTIFKSISCLSKEKNIEKLASLGHTLADELFDDVDLLIEEQFGSSLNM